MNRFQQLFDYVEAEKPEMVLEIGTWNGDTAKQMLNLGAKVYIGFDIWEEGDENLDELENNKKKRVTKAEVEEKLKDYDIELIQGNTRQTLSQYAKGKAPFVDMAFIDGGHSKGTIKSDLMQCFKLVKTSGVVFLDDYYFNYHKENVGAQTVLAELNIPYTVLPAVDKIKNGPTIKLVRIDMKNVPRNEWEMPDEQTWQFEPEEAA